MSSKQTAYEFWNNVLGSPKFVAAPMVDMSELAYRLLCRRHGAQLCYSPMFHSQQFLQDFLYRQDMFSSCPEDRPLIVQFCANDPNIFSQAASLVSSQCDGIDLNLGCPQAIARKGNYGAFLQDDWDLIHSMVRKAAFELPIPVTCKMRILPGHFKKSVEYAKMLENSGCSVLTIHGRTREQKGHATGLASWDVIKEIKANVNIPVIANGNILTFQDVEACLEYTGVDAVMSAEALLHNPSLFSSKNPPVWNIVEEYLSIAEKCNTPFKCVRCHLFKILYLCIHQDEEISQILADASTMDDFYSVLDVLKKLPGKESDINGNAKETPDFDDISQSYKLNVDNLFEASQDSSIKSDTEDDKNIENSMVKENIDNININEYKNSMSIDLSESDSVESAPRTNNICSEDIEDSSFEYLPVWLCHSRPRMGNTDKSRGCYSQYFPSSEEKSVGDQYMSKKKLRRERHHERVVASMKEKRKVKKMRRKLKAAEMKNDQPKVVKDDTKEKLTKKQQKMLIRERLLKAQGTAPKVCINLGFASTMVEKELNQLVGQLRRLYGSNRHSFTPLHLYFCNMSPLDKLYQMCLAKNDGFSSYVVDMSPEVPENLFALENLIYLSPDSENVLETLDKNKIYVIGGIVDGTSKKDLSLNYAKSFNIQTARLPIPEYLVRCSANPGTTVLTVNQVFDILLKYYETENWVEALGKNVPLRKGYRAPSIAEEKKKNCEMIKCSSGDSELNSHELIDDIS